MKDLIKIDFDVESISEKEKKPFFLKLTMCFTNLSGLVKLIHAMKWNNFTYYAIVSMSLKITS
ncbi:MAG: hypothetical protein IPG07_06235 [Crocinitomicaceae bacterium]|nr:hypothetical protein [Crocinitomicaceae bacterium]